MKRRDYLKTAGGIGTAAIVGGLGLGAVTSSASADLTGFTANNVSVTNDRGDLTTVSVDPTFRVEWENFDEAVGKVFFAVQATTPSTGEWHPLFRTTPWLTSDGNGNPARINGWRPNGNAAIDYSKPGTTGYLEFTRPISKALELSAKARDAYPEFAGPVADHGIRVATTEGRPNYQDVTLDPDLENYLDGNSIGNTYPEVVNDVDAEYTVSVGTDTQLQNGTYGAAVDTDEFDVSEDGTSAATNVSLRYLISFRTPNDAMVSAEPSGGIDSDWFENVRASDVRTGNSVQVMNGQDGYADITSVSDGSGFQATSPATNDYGQLVEASGNHPAILASRTSFDATVTNQEAGSGVGGSSNAGASGGGQ